jgi:lycopene cyclase CruA
MKEIFYTEVLTPATEIVKKWLQDDFQPVFGCKVSSPSGCLVQSNQPEGEWSIFVGSLQRTTYLKVFRWSDGAVP